MLKTMSYSRPGKIDTGIKGRFFDKYEMTIYGFLSNLYLGYYLIYGVCPGTRAFNKRFGTCNMYVRENASTNFGHVG